MRILLVMLPGRPTLPEENKLRRKRKNLANNQGQDVTCAVRGRKEGLYPYVVVITRESIYGPPYPTPSDHNLAQANLAVRVHGEERSKRL